MVIYLMGSVLYLKGMLSILCSSEGEMV